MKNVQVFLWAVTLLLTGVGNGQAKPVYLAVAASMTDAFKEIVPAFTEQHQSIRVFANYGSSGALAKQIAQGAPADLYVSANPRWMAFVRDKGHIAESTERIFVYNSLVFVGAAETDITRLEEIPNLRRIAIGNPQSVPAGQYAQEALEGAGLYNSLRQERKLVMAKDVRQALLYADRGEVEGAFVYQTDALLARRARVLFTVPGNMHSAVEYPLALTASGQGKTEAEALYAFLASARVKAILEKHGFRPAE